jgi:hypothetical protein
VSASVFICPSFALIIRRAIRRHLNLSVFTLAHLHLHLRFGPASPYIVRPYDRDDITTTFPRLVYIAVAGTDTYTTIWIDIHKPIDIGELARLALPPVRLPAVEGDTNDKRRHSVDLPATTDRFLDEQTKFVIKKGGALLPPSVPLQGDIKSRNTITHIDEPVVSLKFESEASEPRHAVTIITALDWINGAVPTADRHAWRHRPEWHGQEYPMLVKCYGDVLKEFAEVVSGSSLCVLCFAAETNSLGHVPASFKATTLCTDRVQAYRQDYHHRRYEALPRPTRPMLRKGMGSQGDGRQTPRLCEGPRQDTLASALSGRSGSWRKAKRLLGVVLDGRTNQGKGRRTGGTAAGGRPVAGVLCVGSGRIRGGGVGHRLCTCCAGGCLYAELPL